MAWGPADTAELVRLHDEQKTFGEIGRALGISRNACIGKAHRMGLCARAPGGNRTPRDKKPVVPLAPKPKASRSPRPYYLPASVEPFVTTIEQLESGMCRYPTGDGPFLFCSQPAPEDQSYCALHQKLTHIPNDR